MGISRYAAQLLEVTETAADEAAGLSIYAESIDDDDVKLCTHIAINCTQCFLKFLIFRKCNRKYNNSIDW